MKKLFSKRHFEWLAHFAGANLSVSSARHLAEALVDTNDNYDMQKFLGTYHRVRNFVKAHDRMHEAAAAQTAHHTQQEYNEAADAIMNTALEQAGIATLPWHEDSGVMVPEASQRDDFIDRQPVATVADAFDAYLRRHREEAIEAGVDAIFQHHRCWKCDSGRKPCTNAATGGPGGCQFLYAAND